MNHISKQPQFSGVERTIFITDSQDTDQYGTKLRMFAPRNYIIDVSSHSRGVNYNNMWTSEISGWSEKVIDYIVEMERQLTISELVSII